MSGQSWSTENIESAREAVHRGELSLTLEATVGERFRLADLGKLCTGFDKLMRAVGKEAAPDAKVEWCVTGLGLLDNRMRVTIGAFAAKPKTRSSSKKPALR